VIALPLRGQYIVIARESLYESVNQGVTWRKLSEGGGTIYVADARGQHLYRITLALLESTDSVIHLGSYFCIDPSMAGF
jgi:hypothetical protein